MTAINQYFASCSKGVEDLLQAELARLDIDDIKVATGGVIFRCEPAYAYKACLWSRVASRILLLLSEFTIDSDDDLYRQVFAVDWSAHFSVDKTLAIDCFSSHSVVNNSHYAMLRVKDAIVDQFKQNTDTRPDIQKDSPQIRINIYLSDRQCMLYLDMSGEALHKRGYRQQAGRAPLRETVAAAMLYRAKWQSFYEKGLPFYDPMCGSATLLIEAALMAADIAPGLLREKYGINFGFDHWQQFEPQVWREILEEAEQRKQQGLKQLPFICGSDSDEQMVGLARKNLSLAELPSRVKITLQDATDNLKPPVEPEGLIVSNPPYGKRIGQVQQLRTLYHRFGKQLKAHFNGWTLAIITSEEELARSLGLRAFHKNTLYNGALRSVLYQYRIDARPGSGASQDKAKGTLADSSAPAEGGKAESSDSLISEHARMFANRLTKNYKHLKKWARRNDISCYRVYDADIPQYAVAIDKYEDWVHVQEYQAPKTVDKNRAFQRINDVIDVVSDILETEQSKVVLKVRKKQEGSSQYQRQGSGSAVSDNKIYGNRFQVTEGGHRFIVNLQDYIDTGLFLDHRQTRQLIQKLAQGCDFLNLFAYTGSVTVYAAAGNARSTTTVDMSNTYLKWAQENMSINGYQGEQHHYVRDDCLQWMQTAIQQGRQYQLIFIDPPTFSNSKKMETTLDINRDHAALLSGALALLADEGRIIFSTNSKNFKLDASLLGECYLKEITAMTTTEDYKRKPQHRCWCITKQEELLKLNVKSQ